MTLTAQTFSSHHTPIMQFIPKDEVARLTPYGALIQSLAKGLREPIESPPRSHFNPNHDASTVLIMPAWRPKRMMGTKIVSIWPENNARGKPASRSVRLASAQDSMTLTNLFMTIPSGMPCDVSGHG